MQQVRVGWLQKEMESQQQVKASSKMHPFYLYLSKEEKRKEQETQEWDRDK